MALGAAAVLVAGAAWASRRGGRSRMHPELERQTWSLLMPDDTISELNPIQLEALKKGRFVFPDGSPADGKILVARSDVFLARVEPDLLPTPRGAKVKGQPRVYAIASTRELYNEHRAKLLMLEGEEEDLYFFFPKSISVGWTA